MLSGNISVNLSSKSTVLEFSLIWQYHGIFFFSNFKIYVVCEFCCFNVYALIQCYVFEREKRREAVVKERLSSQDTEYR